MAPRHLLQFEALEKLKQTDKQAKRATRLFAVFAGRALVGSAG